jgi:cytochrome c-type biogenesis protein CcmH
LHLKEMTMHLIWAIGLMAVFSFAASATPQNKEESARELEAMLIAPCCWSQPVSQHYSEAADQIRREVREFLAAGKSKQEILDHYVSMYGERILASPRPRGFNLLAYVLPFVFLLAGMTIVVMFLKKRTALLPGNPPSDAARCPLDEQYARRVESEMRELQ